LLGIVSFIRTPIFDELAGIPDFEAMDSQMRRFEVIKARTIEHIPILSGKSLTLERGFCMLTERTQQWVRFFDKDISEGKRR